MSLKVTFSHPRIGGDLKDADPPHQESLNSTVWDAHPQGRGLLSSRGESPPWGRGSVSKVPQGG